jgi:hypothetical protein
MYDITFS